MKKFLFVFSLCFILIWQRTYANNSEEVYDDLEDVFEYVDLEQVSTGILADYGLHLVDLELYGGEISDSNYINDFVWKSLYAGLKSSIVNDKSQMQKSDSVFNQLSENNSIGIMYYKYNAFTEDALERGLITFEDEKIRLVPGKPSPYVEKECFAVMPQENTMPYGFDKNNFFTNTGLELTKVEYKIGDGNYRVIPFLTGLSHRVPINTPGEYDVTFRATFSNGKVMESHSIITVPENKSDPEKVKDQYGVKTFRTIAADYSQSGGTIQVKYMKNTPAKNGEFVRPLIIVEDMDLSVLSGDLKMDLGRLLSEYGDISNVIDQLSQMFDIIYIDFNDGLDDLLRNAEMLRKALKEINANRYSVSGLSISDESYIIGLGTGGVISRIVVNMMENANEDHKVQKIVAINSPFRGINIPVGIQTFMRHGKEFVPQLDSEFSFLNGIFDKYVSFLDKRGIQQLLIQYVKNYSINNTEHDLFLTQNNLLKPPTECENVIVTNGSNCLSKLYDPYTSIMHLQLDLNGGKIGIKKGLFIEVKAHTLPDKQEKEIYSGQMRQYRSIWGFRKTKKRCYRNVSSKENLFSIDGLSGTYLETSFINNWAFSINENLNNLIQVDKFCFVPTFSALDIDMDKYFSTDDLEELRGEMNADRAYWTGKNSSYTDFSGIINILMQEIVPVIYGQVEGILDDTELFIDNLPNIPTASYNWNFKNGNFRVVSKSGNKAVVRPLGYDSFNYADTVTASGTITLSN